MTRYILSLLFILLLSPLFSMYTVKQIPNVHVENRSRYVSNPDGILSPGAQAMCDSILSGIWRTSSVEAVAVVVNEIDGGDIDSFATSLFSEWGIGKSDNDNGLLVLIVKDMRRAAIRTGYGIEGVVPDVVAGRVIRENMAPHFKAGDYDTGTVEALARLANIITDPEAASELMSKHANDAAGQAMDSERLFGLYKMFCVVVLVAMLLFYIGVLANNKGKPAPERYKNMHQFKIMALVATFLGLGIPLVVFLLAWWSERRIRTKKRLCPNCKARMARLSEDEDNKYLTAAQDLEERLDSVDYDVWLCSKCGETDVLPFVKSNNAYNVCQCCGARTSVLTANRIVLKATTAREGRGVRIYSCRNCRHNSEVPYKIPKEEDPIAPIFIGGGGGGRGFGGGGFSGGNFGGGMTGGGGASGGW